MRLSDFSKPGNFGLMQNLISLKEQSSYMSFEIKIPNLKYISEAFRTKCTVDIIKLGLFPNAKEVTEGFGFYNAVRKYLWAECKPNDENINLVVVGDGSTPRTAALFAFRSAWQCYSIDPNMNVAKNWSMIKRLHVYNKKVEEIPLRFPSTTIILSPHAHVNVDVILKNITAPRRHLLVLPCCINIGEIPRQPDIRYDDWGIWSPQRNMMIWRDV